MKRLASLALLLSSAVAALAQAGPERRITVPDINSRATLLIHPDLTGEAVKDGFDGSTVVVRVVVDGDGNVVSATCPVSCSPVVRERAEKAAKESKFKPLVVNGEAVRYEGLLIYTFALGQVNWFAFGTSLKSAYLFDNISLGPPAAHLIPEFGEEKAQLQQLDRGKVPLETRWKTIREVAASIKKKLKPREAWLFDLGLTLRNVTYITVLAGPTNRADLQKAFKALGPLAASAPPEIAPELVEEIRKLSDYIVPLDLPERELRKTVLAMTVNIRPSI